MPIYADVLTRIDERSARTATDALEKQVVAGAKKTGENAATALGESMASQMGAIAGKVAGELTSHLTSEFTSGIPGVSTGLRSIGSVAEEMGSTTALAGVAAAGGLAAIVAAAYEVGSALYDVGERFDAISDSIAVRTGKMGDDLNALTQSIHNVANTTASSIENIADIGSRVSQSLHLSGQPLEDLTKNIADLDRMTGESLNVKAFGEALRGFGQDGDQALPSLNQLNAVVQKTGIPLNDLLNTMKTLGPSARSLGLNFSETAGLIVSFDEAGIDADKTTQGLSKAASTFADKGIDLKTGLADTITQIRGFIDAGNDAAAVDLASKVFGTKGAQAFVDAIRQGKLNVDDLNGGLSTSGDTIGDLTDRTSDWSEQWQILKNNVSELTESIAGPLFEAVNKVLGAMVEFTKPIPVPVPGAPGETLGQSGIYGPPTEGPGVVTVPDGSGLPDVLGFGASGPGLVDPRITAPIPNTVLPPVMRPDHTPQDIAGALAKKDAAGSGPRLPAAPQVPYGPEYGAPPRPGETASQYAAEQRQFEAVHRRQEAEARLAQLKADGKATTDDLVKAENDLIKARADERQAQLSLNESVTKTTAALTDIGVKLDPDLGISKGLAGIADNLVRFVASLAAAPALGRLAQTAATSPSQGGFGLIGQLGAQGAFGPQFTGLGSSGGASGGGAFGAPGGAPIPGVQTAGSYGVPAGTNTGRNNLSQDQIASAIIAEGMRQGKSRDEIIAALNVAKLESNYGANPMSHVHQNQSGTDVQGIFQQDPGYSGDHDDPTNASRQFFQRMGQRAHPGDSAAQEAVRVQVGTYGPGYVDSQGQGATYDRLAPRGPIPGATPDDVLGPGGGMGGGGMGLGMPGGPAFPAPTGHPYGDGQAGVGGPLPGFGGVGASTHRIGTRIGGVAPPSGSGKGGIGITDGGSIDTAMGLAATAFPGVGQAAQTGMKLANRGIQFAGQAAAIGVQGALETFLPTGGSELANRNWFTRIVGGIAGAAPALPNMAGKPAGGPTPEGVANADPNGAPNGQGATNNNTNITVNNQRATEDGTGRDVAHAMQSQYEPAGMP